MSSCGGASSRDEYSVFSAAAAFGAARSLPKLAVFLFVEILVLAEGNLVRSMAARIHHWGSTSLRTTRDFSVSMDSRGAPSEKFL